MQEKTTNKWYNLAKDTETITLTEDQITSIKFENEKKKDKLR